VAFVTQLAREAARSVKPGGGRRATATGPAAHRFGCGVRRDRLQRAGNPFGNFFLISRVGERRHDHALVPCRQLAGVAT